MKPAQRRGKIIASAAWPLALAASALGQTFSGGTQTGKIQNALVVEASGIVASRQNPNVLWTHNDSGNAADIFPMTSAGTDLGTYTVGGQPGVTVGNTDWEDISLGPGPVAGTPYLYIGDIGDNNNDRAKIAVYRLPEPVVSDTQSPLTTTLSGSVSGAVKLTMVYPDGLGHNAESMFVDPLTKDIYIITKHVNPTVYVAPYPQSTGGTITLMQVATFTDPDPPTAADISDDGSEIVVRGYPTSSGFMFKRPTGGTIADAFNSPPISISLHSELQGEAIGFDPNNSGYFTTSDGGGSQPIYYMTRTSEPPATLYWDNDGAPAGTYTTSGTGMGGAGTWDTTKKWYTGGAEVPWASGANAVFWGTPGTVTLSAAQTVSTLSFKSDGYILSGSTITLTGSTINVDSGVTVSMGSKISGSAGLIKNGAGTLNLSSSNQYTGGTIINAGVLGIVSSSVGALPTAPMTNVTINNGSTLRFNLNGLTLATNRQIVLGNGGGTIDTNGNADTIAGVISGTSMTKAGTGTLVLSSANNAITGPLSLAAGALSITGATTVGSISQTGGTLSITGNLHLAASGRSSSSTSILSAAPTIGAAGQLDIEDNALIVTYDTSDTIHSVRDQIRNLLINGRNSPGGQPGNWNGLGGITSTFAHNNGDGFNLAIGYGDNEDIALVRGSGSYTAFGGQTVASNTVLIQLTRGADATMDGVVDAQDVTILGSHFNKPNSGQWVFGDFDYSGTCDATDVTTLGSTFGKTTPTLSPAQMTAEFGAAFTSAFEGGQAGAVPEPASLTLIALGGVAMMGKRPLRRRLGKGQSS